MIIDMINRLKQSVESDLEKIKQEALSNQSEAVEIDGVIRALEGKDAVGDGKYALKVKEVVDDLKLSKTIVKSTWLDLKKEQEKSEKLEGEVESLRREISHLCEKVATLNKVEIPEDTEGFEQKEWIDLIVNRIRHLRYDASPEKWKTDRTRLQEVAAISIAAIEALDQKYRADELPKT